LQLTIGEFLQVVFAWPSDTAGLEKKPIRIYDSFLQKLEFSFITFVSHNGELRQLKRIHVTGRICIQPNQFLVVS
jgi:hypothetical protein